MENSNSEQQTNPNYNLLDAKWIPVLYSNGKFERVGVLDAYKQAVAIRQIAASNPMDRFAILRFLLTLLYWKADSVGGIMQVRESLLQGNVPQVLLDAIKTEEGNFNLFDDQIPFLQDPTVKSTKKQNLKSVGSFFAEFATGTNIAHFHHGDDMKMKLCLRCVTMGLVRVIPWSQSGGAGVAPSVHSSPPIMALALGKNLVETLGLNLVPLDVEPGRARWTGYFKPTDKAKPIPYLDAFTWNSRRIWLPAPETIERCWGCGRRGVEGVGQIVLEKNPNTTQLKNGDKTIPFRWNDPAAYYDTKQEMKKATSEPKDAFQLFRTKKSDKEAAVMISAELSGLKDDFAPECRIVNENPDHDDWRLIIPTTDNKAKTFDHRYIETESLAPPAIQEIINKAQKANAKYEKHSLNGWDMPESLPMRGEIQFIQFALKILSAADWTVLSNASFKRMDEALDAFDLLAGIYWSLKGSKPSRNAAWLTLKLMASVPAHFRTITTDAYYTPFHEPPKLNSSNEDEKKMFVPKHQIKRKSNDPRVKLVQYPLALPKGTRLETALRECLDRNINSRTPKSIDWAGLCHALNTLLN